MTNKILITIGGLGFATAIGVGTAVGFGLKSSFGIAASAVIGTIAGIVAMPIAVAVIGGVAACCGVVALIVILPSIGAAFDRIERGGPAAVPPAVSSTSRTITPLRNATEKTTLVSMSAVATQLSDAPSAAKRMSFNI